MGSRHTVFDSRPIPVQSQQLKLQSSHAGAQGSDATIDAEAGFN